MQNYCFVSTTYKSMELHITYVANLPSFPNSYMYGYIATYGMV